MGGHLVGGAVELFDHGFLHDLHALLFKLLLGVGGNLRVLDRQDAIHHLNNRRFGAERVVEAGEFDADGAGADDQQLLRHVRRLKRVFVSPDPFAVRLKPRQFAGAGAGGEDDVLRGQFLPPLVGLDGDLAGRGDRRLAHHHLHLVLLEKVADAGVELFRDAARAFHHGVDVIADPVGLKPEFLGPVHQVKDFGRPQQRLRRDAAPVQANAAQMFALNDCGLQPQLRRADRRDIAPRPRADHDHIKIRSHLQPSVETFQSF